MSEKTGLLIEKLAARTELDKLLWEQSLIGRGGFQVVFPNQTLVLRSPDDAGDPDFHLQIYNENGSLIEDITDRKVNKYFDGHAYDYMNELYEKVRRKAMGVDGAVDEVLGELEDDDPFA